MREYCSGYVRKNHAVWQAVVKWKEDGRRGSSSKSTGIRCYPDKVDKRTGKVIKLDNRGKASAEQFLRKWRADLEFGPQLVEEPVEPDLDGLDSETPAGTLDEYVETFLSFKNVKGNTMVGYRAVQKKIKDSPLGSSPLGAVTAKDVLKWESSLFNSGLCEATVAHYHAFLSQVFKYAHMVGDVDKNPMVAVKPPRIRRKAVNSLTRNVMVEVYESLSARGYDDLGTAGIIALTSGMRRGEICALRWVDVDFERHLLHVNHSLSTAGGLELVTPKDPAGGDATRTIPLYGLLEDCLERRLAASKSEVAGFCSWDEYSYVIGNPISGRPKNPTMLTKEWSTLVKVQGWRGTQGEPPRFHDLRHTFATHALANGSDIMAVASILGHRNPSTTLDIYAIVLEESKRSAIEDMGGIFA